MRQIRIGSAFAGAALALALAACTSTTTVVKYGGSSPGSAAGASASAKAIPSPTGPAVTITPGGGDKTVRIWVVATGEQQRTFEGHNDWIGAVAIPTEIVRKHSTRQRSRVRLCRW